MQASESHPTVLQWRGLEFQAAVLASTMNDELSEDFRREMREDFYAECDELMTGVRSAIERLEVAQMDPAECAAQLEILFRTLHSLKGISAIVGERSAEQLAHSAEDLLRSLMKRAAPPDLATIDLLSAATERFEKIIAADKLGIPPPPINDLVQKLDAAYGVPLNIQIAGAVSPAVPHTASATGQSLCRMRFFISPELEKKGVNVSTLREKIGALGKILQASPVIEGGKVSFAFAVQGRGPWNSLVEWAGDALRIEETTDASKEASPAIPDFRRPQSPAPNSAEAGKSPDNAPSAFALGSSHLVRVDLARLDDLMRLTGELVIQRSRLESRLDEKSSPEILREISASFGRSLRDMRRAVTQVRMVPINEIFARIPFIVRDLKRISPAKAVRVELEGQQTEVDKFLVERLKEPLLHLVRNAFAHGVETTAERLSLGKPAEAVISLSARSAGDFVHLEIRDDGRGIDAKDIARRAKKLGLPFPDAPTPGDILHVLCAPGFSTQESADLAAGRGVGMTVVAARLGELGGVLTLESHPHAGTSFHLKLPLTLSIVDAVITRVGTQLCAIPQGAIVEVVQKENETVRSLGGREMVPDRENLLPIIRLRKIFGLPASSASPLTLLIMESPRGRFGLVVDRLQGQREIVVRPLTDPLIRVAGVAGATELGDGKPVLILDVSALDQMEKEAQKKANSANRLAPMETSR